MSYDLHMLFVRPGSSFPADRIDDYFVGYMNQIQESSENFIIGKLFNARDGGETYFFSDKTRDGHKMSVSFIRSSSGASAEDLAALEASILGKIPDPLDRESIVQDVLSKIPPPACECDEQAIKDALREVPTAEQLNDLEGRITQKIEDIESPKIGDIVAAVLAQMPPSQPEDTSITYIIHHYLPGSAPDGISELFALPKSTIASSALGLFEHDFGPDGYERQVKMLYDSQDEPKGVVFFEPLEVWVVDKEQFKGIRSFALVADIQTRGLRMGPDRIVDSRPLLYQLQINLERAL
jgi:hypothetical protein